MTVNLQRTLAQAQQRLKGTLRKGIVVNNVDTLKQQRLQIRVRDVHRDIPDSALPWAVKRGRGSYASAGVGEVDVPPIGAEVTVYFNDNTLYHTEWQGASTNTSTGAESTLPNYPWSRGRSDVAGYQVWINQEAGQESINVKAPDGMVLEIMLGSTFTLNYPKDLVLNIGGKTSIKSKGDLLLSSEGSVTITGQNTAINGTNSLTFAGNGSSMNLGSSFDIEADSCNINSSNTRLSSSGNVVLDASSFQCNASTNLQATNVQGGDDTSPVEGAPSPGGGGNPITPTAPSVIGSFTTYSRPTVSFTPNQMDY